MASFAKKKKGTMKELSTFLKWGKEGIIGHKIETFESKQYVTKIWCKLCAKYREQIVNHPTCRGAPVIAIKAFADGTEVVTKHQASSISNLSIDDIP